MALIVWEANCASKNTKRNLKNIFIAECANYEDTVPTYSSGAYTDLTSTTAGATFFSYKGEEFRTSVATSTEGTGQDMVWIYDITIFVPGNQAVDLTAIREAQAAGKILIITEDFGGGKMLYGHDQKLGYDAAGMISGGEGGQEEGPDGEMGWGVTFQFRHGEKASPYTGTVDIT